MVECDQDLCQQDISQCHLLKASLFVMALIMKLLMKQTIMYSIAFLRKSYLLSPSYFIFSAEDSVGIHPHYLLFM